MVKRIAGYILLGIWPAVFLFSIWTEAHACGGHTCGLWQDVVLKSPLKPRPHINIGQALERHGLADQAIQEYQQAEVLSLDRSRHEARMTRLLARMNISNILLKSGQREDAHQILKSAWLEDPGFPGYAINLSLFYIQERQFEKAIAFLTEGIARIPDYQWFSARWTLYLNRGEAYRFLGQCDLAARDYREARKDPDLQSIQIPDCVPTETR